MHPPSFFSFVTSKKFIPILICGIIILAFFFYGIVSYSPATSGQLSVTSPTPIPIVWKEKPEPAQNFSIQLPANWAEKINAVPTDRVQQYIYTVNGTVYTFTISPPGQGVADASLMQVDTITHTPVVYGGRNFLLSIWKYQGTPFLIEAVPNEQEFYFSSFAMQLPPVNTDQYIALFEQVMQKLQLPKNLQISPQPTLEGAGTVTVGE